MEKAQAIDLATEWVRSQCDRAVIVIYAIEFQDDAEIRRIVERCDLELNQVEHLWGTWLVGFAEFGVNSTTDVAVNPATMRICLQSQLL